MPALAPSPAVDPALASWITAPGEDPQNPLLRVVVDLPAPPVSATLLVTGLGTFRAALNGTEVDDARLDPGLTDPRARVQVRELEVGAQIGRASCRERV